MYFGTVFVLVSLYNHVLSANILCIFPFPSVSHQSVYGQIWKSLAEKGHNVVAITPNPIGNHSLPTLTEIDASSAYKLLESVPLQNVLTTDKTLLQQYNDGIQLSFNIVDYILNLDKVKQLLIDQERHFDLVIIENFFPMLHALGPKYRAPVIGITSFPPLLQNLYAVANPSHPILYQDLMIDNKKDQTFFERIYSTYHQVVMTYNHYYNILPNAQKIAAKHFNTDLDLYELERNVSLVIANVNPLIFNVRPNVPAAIEMSLIHMQEPKSLTKDLKEIVEKAKNGVVYFSLGSNVKSVNIDDKLKRVIMDALSELPYTVIWKWEADHMPGKPDNVVIRKWLPQQDLLAHPNVKAFVTQGGLQSAEEAISAAVPMVGIPFFGDQPMNVMKLAEAGIAINLNKDTLTKEELKNAILEVAGNPKYREKAKEIRDLFYDQPMKSLDKAIWWIEYVIRHKGARHLRSPALDLPLYQYFLLDVIGVTLLALFVIIYVTIKLVKFVLSLVGVTKKVKKS